MGNLTLAGATSGQVTISPPAVAGTNTLSLPAATGTLIYGTQPAGTIVGTTDTQTLTNKTLTSPTINTPVMGGSVITSGTAQASTSGTTITFTGIPSWVKRITVMLYNCSTSGTSGYKMTLGTASGLETSGYLGNNDSSSGSDATNLSSSFLITPSTALSAASVLQGRVEFVNITGNVWVGVAQTGRSDGTGTGSSFYTAGSKALSGVLTQLQISTGNGTDTFDAGTINILYE